MNYTKDKEITKARAEKEEKVKKCLNYLGIKETYILDHLDSNFQKALEKKTYSKLRE